MHLRIASAEPKQTFELGRGLGVLLEVGDVVALIGDLGAGKTCLTQGIARGLGVDPHYRVASPTFTLINEYPGRVPLAHLDLYRLDGPEEMLEVGVFDYLGGAQVCVVEWFDRLTEGRPRDYLELRISVTGDQQRELEVVAQGERHQQLARRWLAAHSFQLEGAVDAPSIDV